ncbi:tlde1 domain-containing protein [Phreatobacter sp.]|uniref:DUF2778 domain-containing protein n=1 Tax=Phreatobacter sp. TaxID=1966341 RepID=UPI003F7106C2
MTQGRDTLCEARHGATGSRRRGAFAVVALTLSALVAGAATYAAIDPRVARTGPASDLSAAPRAVLSSIRPDSGLLRPEPTVGAAVMAFGRNSPLSARLEAPPEPVAAPFTVASLPPTSVSLVLPDAAPEPEAGTVPEDAPDLAAPLPPARPASPVAPSLLGAPMPMPRPADAPSAATAERQSPGARRSARASEPPAASTAPNDGRSLFQRLFGQPREPSGPELAYAPANRPMNDATGPSLGERLRFAFRGPAPRPPPGTAIYDITARAVYLPNGERLRAHSGLGEKMDDPRFVHVRMEGPTPPHTYDLVEREAPFHGVRAIRLNPVGGSEAIHGRTGLLAHHFLMGPRGDSNGCLSIEQYDKFLQAYLRGEIRRLIVVARSS